MEDREQILRLDGYLIGIATLGLVNGMEFSPWYEPSYVLLRPIFASLFITSPILVLYFSSLVAAVAALMISGVPAAIYERVTGRTRSDPRSMAVWLGSIALISIPALLRMVGLR